MDNLHLTHTDETPELIFNTDGNLLIKGISIPENVGKFYTPVIDWLNQFKETKPAHIALTFQIEYINTSSARVFIDIIKNVQTFVETGTTIEIIWLHDEEDEDNVELGEELQFSSKTNFLFKVA